MEQHERAAFSPVAGKAISAAFDGGRLTSDAGVLVLAEIERRLGIAERLARCIEDPRHRSGCTTPWWSDPLPDAVIAAVRLSRRTGSPELLPGFRGRDRIRPFPSAELGGLFVIINFAAAVATMSAAALPEDAWPEGPSPALPAAMPMRIDQGRAVGSPSRP